MNNTMPRPFEVLSANTAQFLSVSDWPYNFLPTTITWPLTTGGTAEIPCQEQVSIGPADWPGLPEGEFQLVPKDPKQKLEFVKKLLKDNEEALKHVGEQLKAEERAKNPKVEEPEPEGRRIDLGAEETE